MKMWNKHMIVIYWKDSFSFSQRVCLTSSVAGMSNVVSYESISKEALNKWTSYGKETD